VRTLIQAQVRHRTLGDALSQPTIGSRSEVDGLTPNGQARKSLKNGITMKRKRIRLIQDQQIKRLWIPIQLMGRTNDQRAIERFPMTFTRNTDLNIAKRFPKPMNQLKGHLTPGNGNPDPLSFGKTIADRIHHQLGLPSPAHGFHHDIPLFTEPFDVLGDGLLGWCQGKRKIHLRTQRTKCIPSGFTLIA
jgi:hypothetical protein